MTTILHYIRKHKYEVLLLALIQHMFIGIFITDMVFYRDIIWAINMFILGIATIGVFIEKGKRKNRIRKVLFFMVLALPICLPFLGHLPNYFLTLCLIYVLFFAFIFWEVLKFLIRPSYINADIISASACGYFLLIEICTFLLQFFAYQNPQSFKGVDYASPALTFIDLVYFSAITLTSIGFGDITPNSHHTKLITSFFGIAGQFYSVVLVGILISKFTSKSSDT